MQDRKGLVDAEGAARKLGEMEDERRRVVLADADGNEAYSGQKPIEQLPDNDML